MTQTGNSLDVAVVGNAWIGFAGPSGAVYTRDGRMQISSTGELQTVTGYPVLDAGGTPILVDPDAGPLTIARNGTISQGDQSGRRARACSTFPPTPSWIGSPIRASFRIAPRRPLSISSARGFQQGYVEGSNVDPLLELTQMMNASARLPGRQLPDRGLREHDAERHPHARRAVQDVVAGRKT